VLEARHLAYERNNQPLFSNLTFKIKPSEALLVQGKNGAGKSSLLKILAGLWRPGAGTLLWQDQTLNIKDPSFLSQVLYLGHKLGIQPALTVIQNLQWLLEISTLRTYSQTQIASVLAEVGLDDFGSVVCEDLSKGQQQRLALARLWLDPRQYWILDEPTTALDEIGVELLYQRIVKHLTAGGLLVMASHRTFNFEQCKQINKIEVVLDQERCSFHS